MSKILDGVQAIWKGVTSKVMSMLTAGASVVLAVMLASSGGDKDLAQNRLDDAEQRIIAGDSIMIITAKRDTTGKTISRDTVSRLTTEQDLNTGMFRLEDTTANGFTMYIVTIEAIDLLTSKDSVHYILASTPAIGTQWNLKIRQGKTEIAVEKIPEELDKLPLEKTVELGYTKLIDTVEIEKDVLELRAHWTTDDKEKAVYVPLSKDLVTEIEK
jgi:hypothetical protein